MYIFEQMTAQVTCLTRLDSIWDPKRVPKGAQDDSKTDPERVQNRVQKWKRKNDCTMDRPGLHGTLWW